MNSPSERSRLERVETPPSPISINVPALDAAFVDRQTLFDKLRDKISSSEAPVALIGLGGLGCVSTLT